MPANLSQSLVLMCFSHKYVGGLFTKFCVPLVYAQHRFKSAQTHAAVRAVRCTRRRPGCILHGFLLGHSFAASSQPPQERLEGLAGASGQPREKRDSSHVAQ